MTSRRSRAVPIATAAALLAAMLPALAAGPAAGTPLTSGVMPQSASAPRADDGSAGGPPVPVSKVTIAARSCPQYSDIMANRARNNIQESLRDLGIDTKYGSGEAVHPEKEDQFDPNCTPLTGFQFTLGTGYNKKSPATENLSTVKNPMPPTIATVASVPQLNRNGQPEGNKTVEGAVTIDLTPAQASLAQQHKLWIQGGTPGDPQGTALFNGKYAFGALRCAIDNLNGDNVEWIGYPTGSSHVFCYYYAVTPPPSAGTIVVEKRLADGAHGPTTFDFQGNISYNPGGGFQITADVGRPGRIEFVRAAGDPWSFREIVPAGWQLDSLTCASAQQRSNWSTDLATASATVYVEAGDTVTCTYVDSQPPPPPGRLRLFKQTRGGVGSFPVRVTRPDGSTGSYTATTTVEGASTLVAASSDAIPPQIGTYTVRETLPAPDDTGRWKAVEAVCNGDEQALKAKERPDGSTDVSFSADATSNVAADCTIVNRFRPFGRITIVKETTTGTGAFAFRATQYDGDTATGVSSTLRAKVVKPGRPVTAKVDDGQPSLTRLPVDAPGDTWQLQEMVPTDDPFEVWTLTDVVCRDDDSGGKVRTDGVDSGVTVTLTERHPRVTCTFTNDVDVIGGVIAAKVVEVGAGSLRDGPATLTLTCDDGSTSRFSVGTDAIVGLSDPVIVDRPRDCVLTETATGEGPGTKVATTWAVVDAFTEKTVAAGSGTTITTSVAPRQAWVIVVLDQYYVPSDPPTVPQVPEPPLTLPPTIPPDVPTAIVPGGGVTTNGGQEARVKVICQPPRRAALVPTGDTRSCRVRRGDDGRVTVIAPRGSRVRVTIVAPATDGYTSMKIVRVYRVRR